MQIAISFTLKVIKVWKVTFPDDLTSFQPFLRRFHKVIEKGSQKIEKKVWNFEPSGEKFQFFFNFEWALFYTRVETAKKWRETG